jgi:hypothetical protein
MVTHSMLLICVIMLAIRCIASNESAMNTTPSPPPVRGHKPASWTQLLDDAVRRAATEKRTKDALDEKTKRTKN